MLGRHGCDLPAGLKHRTAHRRTTRRATRSRGSARRANVMPNARGADHRASTSSRARPPRTSAGRRFSRCWPSFPRCAPTYVIFYDLSRVAREETDAFWLLAEIKRHGAKLESTLERDRRQPPGCCCTRSWPASTPSARATDGEKVKMRPGAQARRWRQPSARPASATSTTSRRSTAAKSPRSPSIPTASD